jgi:hypothetical protein
MASQVRVVVGVMVGAAVAVTKDMTCRRCLRPEREAPDPAPAGASDPAAPSAPGAADAGEGHPPTVLETLRRVVNARGIQSSDAASEEAADAPIRGAWIIR